MPHSIIYLPNGIKLIHEEINSSISHFGVLVNAGTRDENNDKMGTAHFVEHTIFKGTSKRTGCQIIRRLEDVGGDLNASTSKEETYFHASFLSPDYPRAIELLSDIFFHSTFPEKEVEKEKDVVIEEINYYKDTPSELIFDEFENIVFFNHPLERNVLGSKRSVKSINRTDILNFINNNYTKNNIVLSSAGNISTKRLVKLCEKFFSQTKLNETHNQRFPFTDYQPQTKHVNKHTNQAHIILGNISYSLRSEERLAFTLVTNILGGQGMNTRLNMEIREHKGLAYDVEANYSPFSDTGLFSVYIGCDTEMAGKCIELTYKELNKLATQKLSTSQLYYAKKQFIGQLAIANETKLNEMLSIGRTALFFDEVDTWEESVQKIEKLTSEELLETAHQVFDRDKLSMLIYSKE